MASSRRVAMALSLIGILVVAGGFLRQQRPPVPSKTLPEAVAPADSSAKAIVSAASGITYSVVVKPEEFDSDEGERQLEKVEASVETAGLQAHDASAATDGETYRGTARKAAKLSIATEPVEVFTDLAALIATLPSKDAMVHHNPLISTGATSNRVTEERRNVRVRCWLYAASAESDNDFHLILGRAPGLSPKKFMTMEISGLPPATAPSFATLKAARDSFQAFFSGNLPAASYDFYNPPIPVEIEGSLFFDMTHAQGIPPGPSTFRPDMPVIWEVHPVTKITFEPH